MQLPNYFLADLPPGADLSPSMLQEACQTLRRNRETYLAPRSTQSLVNLFTELARSWLDPDFKFRKLVLEQGPAATGFSSATLARGLDHFFSGLTNNAFTALLQQDLGQIERLDRFSPSVTQAPTRLALARGPHLLVHVAAGNIPNPTLTSIILGYLLRSAQFVKCAHGAALIPRLFAHSIYEAAPKLGACLEIGEWRGGNHLLEDALYEEADCVTATGADETLAAIRQRLPSKPRFVAYGHRVSFAYVSAEALSGSLLRRALDHAVEDLVAWNQLGCLSPHVIYVQAGGTASPELFAQALAEALDAREQKEPRGELPPPTAAAISSRRSIYEIRAAHHPGTRLWCSKGSTAWTVVFEDDPRFQLSCLNRFVYVKPVKDLTEALQSADPIQGKVSTVGLEAPEHQTEELAARLADWGVPRVCPLGRMQNPPLSWRHDGRPALADLVTWTDWERS